MSCAAGKLVLYVGSGCGLCAIRESLHRFGGSHLRLCLYVLPHSPSLKLTSIDGGGDVFVGGAVPFGMVKLGLDTYEEPINQSALNGGWTPQGYVTGVSLMHVSGTGGGPKYGFPAQMPLTSIDGDVNLLDNRTYWQKRVSIINATQQHS